jgi:hypothetical protein
MCIYSCFANAPILRCLPYFEYFDNSQQGSCFFLFKYPASLQISSFSSFLLHLLCCHCFLSCHCQIASSRTKILLSCSRCLLYKLLVISLPHAPLEFQVSKPRVLVLLVLVKDLRQWPLTARAKSPPSPPLLLLKSDVLLVKLGLVPGP